MPRYYAVTLDDLAHARVAYELGEPRDLFYRVAQALMADAEAGRGQFSIVEGLAVLLQSWNLGYYRRAGHRFDEAHYEAIGELLKNNQDDIAQLRERPIETLADGDRPMVERIFDRSVAVLGPVGSAKTLHLLAPRWFPIFDNYILDAFHVWARDGRAYWRFMTAIKAQVLMVGGERAAGANVVKGLDELSFCRFTLKLPEFDPPEWIELDDRAKRSPVITASAVTADADLAGREWGSKSEEMRRLFEQGTSIADTARAIGVDYAFAYGVHKRWRAKGGQ